MNRGKPGVNEDAPVNPELMDQIIDMAQTINFGHITLISQNFRLIQIERNEKIRIGEQSKAKEKDKNEVFPNHAGICRKIQQQFRGLEYGQIVIVVNNGIVVRIERIEKQRFSDFTGLDGEGI
ncbi:MAG: YezD family protein [Acidaminococcales bacterium]|nr:YezD family protein [Acidaminococcales bacterium]